MLKFSSSGWAKLPIGMGLSFETLLVPPDPRVDSDREVVQYDLSKYSEFYIDLFTVTREVINALEIKDVSSIRPEHIGETVSACVKFLNEMPEFQGFLKFFSSYKTMSSRRKAINLDTKSGQKQNLLFRTMTIINRFINITNMEDNRSYINSPTTLIMTHNSYWMAKALSFTPRIEILQTHTGKIYNEKDLWRKYPAKKSYDRTGLPLVPALLEVLGDGAYIQPVKASELKELYAEMAKWSHNTSPSIISYQAKKYL